MFQTVSGYLESGPRNGWIAISFVPLVAIAAYTVRLALIYRRLPKDVPVHFGLDGTPNGWMSRPVWAALSPLLLVSLLLFLTFIQHTQPHTPGAIYSYLFFWGALGLVTGAFWGILTAALDNARFNLYGMLVWPVLFVLGEYMVLFLYKAVR